MLSLGPGFAACLKALLDHNTGQDDSSLFFHFHSRVETNNPNRAPEMNNLRCRTEGQNVARVLTGDVGRGELDCSVAPCPQTPPPGCSWTPLENNTSPGIGCASGSLDLSQGCRPDCAKEKRQARGSARPSAVKGSAGDGKWAEASARVGATHKGIVTGGWEPISPKDVMNKMNLARSLWWVNLGCARSG